MTDSAYDNRKLAADLLERYGKNDIAGILDLCTENCTFVIGAGKSNGVVPYHGTHKGHNHIHSYLLKRRAASTRDWCDIPPPGQPSAPVKGAKPAPHKEPQHERLIAHGNIVVAIGRLRDSFADGESMLETDFVIVFEVDEAKKKISSFKYFFDTEGAAKAWRKRDTK